VRSGRGQHRSTTVNEIKLRVQELLARGLSDENCPLSARSIANARSQSLWDHQPVLRCCLDRILWEHFAPDPSWHGW
jgi:hypothetical protein